MVLMHFIKFIKASSIGFATQSEFSKLEVVLRVKHRATCYAKLPNFKISASVVRKLHAISKISDIETEQKNGPLVLSAPKLAKL